MDAALQPVLALAIVAFENGELEQAKKIFQIIATTDPLDPNAHSFLGLIDIQTNQPVLATQHFLEAARLAPTTPLHHANLAGAFIQTSQPEKALTAAKRALALDANYIEALLSAGVALLLLGKLAESRVHLQHLLTLNPNHIEALINLAAGFLQSAQNNAAIEAYRRILQISPKHLGAHFLLCFAYLHYIYNDENEIATARMQYEQQLLRLSALCKQSTPNELSQAATWVGLAQPFLLPYQGKDDRALQSIYGNIVAQFFTARYPEWQQVLPRPLKKRGERIRVGIVSGYFNAHSNWKTHLKGWIQQLNANEFALFGYYTGDQYTEVGKEVSNYLERYTWNLKTINDYAKVIVDDHLDVLIFPEIGMDAMTTKLAALRLAPVQCTSWGQPETSGLDTIDYFLSSALMEPPEGDAYYTEKLIRLPNLSIYYEPIFIPPLKRTRADFGLRDDAILYWCCQTAIKYYPKFDDIFAKIALAVPQAQFVFIESIPVIANQFRLRIEGSFVEHHLNASDHCVFLPKLSGQEFVTATGLMDVFLDSIEWSGCNTALEALEHDLSMVTLPGSLMRSRHTSAILTMMGMEDAIATSVDNYVERAITLGRNSDARTRMRADIARNKYKVYRDNAAIVGLENFLKSVINK